MRDYILWLLITYLWISGGIGWCAAYEKGTKTTLSFPVVVFMVIGHPVVSLWGFISWTIKAIRNE